MDTAKEASSTEEEMGEGGMEGGEDQNTECGQHDWQEDGAGGHDGEERNQHPLYARDKIERGEGQGD